MWKKVNSKRKSLGESSNKSRICNNRCRRSWGCSRTP